MSASTRHLEKIRASINRTIDDIDSGKNEPETLKILMISLDKELEKLVIALGGQGYFFKKTNISTYELSMAEVE